MIVNGARIILLVVFVMAAFVFSWSIAVYIEATRLSPLEDQKKDLIQYSSLTFSIVGGIITVLVGTVALKGVVMFP